MGILKMSYPSLMLGTIIHDLNRNVILRDDMYFGITILLMVIMLYSNSVSIPVPN